MTVSKEIFNERVIKPLEREYGRARVNDKERAEFWKDRYEQLGKKSEQDLIRAVARCREKYASMPRLSEILEEMPTAIYGVANWKDDFEEDERTPEEKRADYEHNQKLLDEMKEELFPKKPGQKKIEEMLKIPLEVREAYTKAWMEAGSPEVFITIDEFIINGNY